MKVLIHGNTYHQIRCEKCNAVLAYAASDITTHKTKIQNKTYICEWDSITCLECGHIIKLDERKIER